MSDLRNRRPPLGLPTGSIRGLLALMIVSVVVRQTIRGIELSHALVETLMIILAHYFTARRLVTLPPDVLAGLEQGGQLRRERYPLYLPRYSIRSIIVLSFVGLGVYLYRDNRLFTPQAFGTVGLVLAFFVGLLLRGIGALFGRWKLPTGLLDWFADTRALLVLFATAALTVCYWVDRVDWLPRWGEHATLAFLLYYIGAR